MFFLSKLRIDLDEHTYNECGQTADDGPHKEMTVA